MDWQAREMSTAVSQLGGRAWKTAHVALVRWQKEPAFLRRVVNAQFRLHRATTLPRTVRLEGQALVQGTGVLNFEGGVSLIGYITPIAFFVHPGGRLHIGRGTFINYGTAITAYQSVIIGRHCHIGQYVFIMDNDEHDIANKWAHPVSRPVVIGDRVWLGARVIVLKGVHIGHDTVVGAGSVVTHDLPANVVAAGVPARVLRPIASVGRIE